MFQRSFSASQRLRGRFLLLRSRAMSAIPAMTAILTAFCLRLQPPPSPTPLCTPISTQGHPRPPKAEGAVEARFSRFSGLQSGPISALFLISNCPVGRGSQRIMVCILADCCVLIANFQRSLDAMGHKALASYRFLFAQVKRLDTKTTYIVDSITSIVDARCL